MKLTQEHLFIKNICYLRVMKSKIEYLFLLEELFKKADLINIYSKFLSDKIQEIGVENLPDNYKETAI